MQQLKSRLRQAAKWLVGPLVRPILHRVRRWHQINAEVDALRSEITALNAAWHNHVPALVNATTSVAALAREQARMRRDHDAALAQIRASLRLAAPAADDGTPRILSPQKIESARADALRLSVGGPPRAGYINVDSREAPGVDVVAAAHTLPFGRGEVSEIVSWHVLERYAPEAVQQVLRAWAGMLKPGGTLRVVVTDAQASIDGVARGEFPLARLRESLLGSGEPVQNLFTADSLRAALGAAGLVGVEIAAQGRPTGAGYELEAAARTPAN